MALITCPDCDKQVSASAPACPHCGRPSEQGNALLGRSTGQHGAVKILSLLMVMIGGGMWLVGLSGLVSLWMLIAGVVCFGMARASG